MLTIIKYIFYVCTLCGDFFFIHCNVCLYTIESSVNQLPTIAAHAHQGYNH